MADYYPSDEYEDTAAGGIPRSALSTPPEVLAHQTMSIGAKRALLASWASDRRAVENCPALRRLENGRELHIDDILDALKALDRRDLLKPRPANVLPFRGSQSHFRDTLADQR
jgi:hypothetical protein